MTPATYLPVTVIVPAYNRQRQLERALASLARQSRLPQKVVVVDDGSSPGLDLPWDLEDRLNVHLIRHPKNLGAAAARNTGLRAAETDWIGFLDSDDLLLAESLESRWRLIESQLAEGASTRTIYGCGWIDFLTPARPLTVRYPLPGRSPKDFASGCWFSPGSCIFLNRIEVLSMVGFQDETLDRFEDVDWFFSLALHGFTLEVLPIVAVAIERSRRNDPAKIETAAASLLRKWQGQPPTLLRCLQSYMDLEIAAANYFAGSKVKAFRRLLSSFAKVPRLSLQLSPGWIKKTGTAVNFVELSNSLLETKSSETVSENNSSGLLDNVELTTKLPKLPRSL